MGNSDKWTTPKQIKIEREGEPRGTRRGRLKKGERRKGRKARLDEVLAAKKEAERYRQWFHDDEKRKIEHPEWYRPTKGLSFFEWKYKERFEEHQLKLKKLIERAVQDGFMKGEESEYYWVELYPF